ncbi:MAG: PilN domain-containing protein [Gaiellaceae bacterium]
MKAVNLLPREANAGRSFRGVDPVRAGGAALTIAVVAAVGGAFALAHSHAASAQRQLTTAKSELAQLQKEQTQGGTVATPILPTPSVTGQTPTWQAAVESALAGRVAWDGVLSQIGRVTPGNVTLTNVTLGGGAAATPGSLSLAGTAFNEDGVAQLLARLQLVSSLSGVTLTSSNADPKSGVVSFVIGAQTNIPVTSVTAVAAGAGA